MIVPTVCRNAPPMPALPVDRHRNAPSDAAGCDTDGCDETAPGRGPGRLRRLGAGRSDTGAAGFSLLEMVLALAILGMSLSILAQIASTGTAAAREARALATARIICQAKLNELLLDTAAGQAPTAVVDAPVESFANTSTETFTHSVQVQPGQLDGLLSVRVTVTALSGDGTTPLARYALDRWVIDPALGLAEAEAEELAMRDELTGGTGEAAP